MSEFSDIFKSLKPGKSNRYKVILLCFLAATTFWFLNALNKEHTTTLNYPLEFLYDRDNYMAVEELPKDVVINVNGIGWNLLKNNLGIKISPLQITVDNPVETKKIASNSLPSLISEQLDDFQLNFVLTDTLHLNMDRISRASFKIVLDSGAIDLDEDIKLNGKVLITPDTVEIQGPEALLLSFRDTIFVNIDEENISSDYNEDIQIPLSENMRSLGPTEVNISFKVERWLSDSLAIPIEFVDFPLDSTWNSTRDEIFVHYYVPESKQDSLKEGDFRIIADFKDMQSEDSLIMPKLINHPDMVSEASIDSVIIGISRRQ